MSKEKELLYILCSDFLKEAELYRLFGSARDLRDIEKYLSERVTGEQLKKARKDQQKLKQIDGRVISIFDRSYPEILKDIYGAPPIIYYKGSYQESDKNAISVVGSRNISEKGKILTEMLIQDFAGYELTIVSGMALGVDTIAHKTALMHNLRTIAVIGSGLDVIYPAINRALYKEISEKGAVITEQPLGTKPLPFNFPKRNRIISGLSRSVVVVEAGEKSGSLITARCAAEQNRDVFTFPRTPLDKNSSGNNQLIRLGAKLITSGRDVLEEIFPFLKKENIDITKNNLSDEEKKILQFIQEDPVNIEKLCFLLDMGPPTLANFLLNLELKGLVKELPGRFYIKLKEKK